MCWKIHIARQRIINAENKEKKLKHNEEQKQIISKAICLSCVIFFSPICMYARLLIHSIRRVSISAVVFSIELINVNDDNCKGDVDIVS